MYKIFDITLDSDIPLPELPQTVATSASIHIQNGIALPPPIPKQIEWFHHWKTPQGEVCISCAKFAESYIIRFPGVVDFIISNNCKSIRYFPEPNIPSETTRHLLLDQVIPRILGHLGRTVLHASAVVLPNGKAVAFVGETGWGKSTIASSFFQNGSDLITDDCLLIVNCQGKIVGIPNYSGLRLYDDSLEAIFEKQGNFNNVAHYSNKKRLILHHKAVLNLPSQVNLDAFFILGNPHKPWPNAYVQLDPKIGADELMMMQSQLFLLDVRLKSVISKQFKDIGRIMHSDKTMFYKLNFSRNYSALHIIQENVEMLLR